MNKKNFYITAALAYATKKPHIGNTYEIVLTDAISRFKKMQDPSACFCTGSDEHGQKIEQLAKSKGIEPQKHVDIVSEEMRNVWKIMNCSYDIFIRTTNEHHVEVVKRIFNKLYQQGDIYKGSYEGFYCVPCESFVTESQLGEENCCPDCGRPITKTKEDAYFFSVAKYKDRLLDHIKNNPDFINPPFYKDELINNFFKTELKDFCVSRSSFKWGVPVDFDPKNVVYVWLDALTTYITAIGFDVGDKIDRAKFEKFWPADAQVIGKDILRFHATIWPMILMALDVPLPKQILVHQWLLCDNQKMSKTTGNVMYADDLVNLFSTDAARFYLLSSMSSSHDGTISYSGMIDTYNLELANTIGNLVKRSCDMACQYFDGNIEFVENETEIDKNLKETCENWFSEYFGFMEKFKVFEAIGIIMKLARFCNKFIDEKAPWTIAKNEQLKPKLNSIMFNSIEAIRFLAIMLEPIMPQTSKKILKQIGIAENKDKLDSVKTFGTGFKQVKIEKPSILFDRIDKEKKLQEIKIYLGNNSKDD